MHSTLFNWTDNFLTGLDFVDLQHQELVSLINNLAVLILNGSQISQASFKAAHQALLDYTRYHFKEEIIQMKALNLDIRHREYHAKEHQTFIQMIRDMDLGPHTSTQQNSELLTWLTNWLAYHILGTDQSMARQIHLIQQGSTPSQAYEDDQRLTASSSEPLVAALKTLFQTVCKRNQSLHALNEALEQRVQQRTAELKEANQKLHRLAELDELTGLHNRRFAMNILDQLWAEMWRDAQPLSLLLLDVDKFKPVNDCFGHATGDALLREIARHLQEAVRTSDYVCRMGGDEFLILCPGSDKEGAAKVAKKILAEQRPFQLDNGQICWNGSLSIGIAEASAALSSIEQLLEAADAALYEVKRQGGRSFALDTRHAQPLE
jgi:hemerythrin